MPTDRTVPHDDPAAAAHLAVERAADDARRGVPVIIGDGEERLAMLAAELVSPPALATAAARFGQGVEPLLAISAHRARVLKLRTEDWAVVCLRLPDWMAAGDINAVADPTTDLDRPLMGPFDVRPQADSRVERAALKLCKLARLLPAAVIWPLPAGSDAAAGPLLSVDAQAVLDQDTASARLLAEVARARVPLADAEDARLVAFRPLGGGIEHVAILVGDPPRGQPVLARLHSECFTGDLLGSLKCDCGTQLRGAIAAIAQAGGGVVLYLAQEGRGIGLISKLKAYSLQDQGWDTVDANLRLGFEVDERVFEPAATMLRHLGFSAVRLMTNNPDKVAALECFDIEVVERVPHSFPPTQHSERYLLTKRDRTGHLL